jgi:hypothetical protein
VIACLPVEELTQDIHVAGMSSGLLDHVNEHPAHRHGVPEPRGSDVLDPQIRDNACLFQLNFAERGRTDLVSAN